MKELKSKIHEIIFEADTFWGKAFDVALLLMILMSISTVLLESVDEIDLKYDYEFYVLEWVFTIIFTTEYAIRVWVVGKPQKYVFSFYGIIDLLSILPSYLGLFFVGAHSFMIIRVIRLFRVFRIFKLVQFIGEASQLGSALRASKHKILVFIGSVLILVVILGSIMYIIEGPQNGFTSIPMSIYWAIVTLTTVGYGDIAPQTVLGQAIASMVMILGYGIIAVPTGIVTSELTAQKNTISANTRSCQNCSAEGHDDDATHCKYCGAKI